MMQIVVEPIWIREDAALQELCERLAHQAAIALDTEFMRTDTFYPIVGLLQINDGRQTFLIDPLSIKDTDALKKIMVNKDVTKVLHSCSEDLEVFQTWLGVAPVSIFDTQIAAAFVPLGYSLSYANLVKTLLNVEIPKDETRSDWLQRPLSVSQIQYAALDVVHMLIVYGKLLQMLKQRVVNIQTRNNFFVILTCFFDNVFKIIIFGKNNKFVQGMINIKVGFFTYNNHTT